MVLPADIAYPISERVAALCSRLRSNDDSLVEIGHDELSSVLASLTLTQQQAIAAGGAGLLVPALTVVTQMK